VVPLSTVTFELDGGQLWPLVADWEPVVEAVVHIARHQDRDAMPMGLPQLTAVLVGGGPTTVHELHHPDGTRSQASPVERQEGHTPTGAELDRIAGTNNYGRRVLRRWKPTGQVGLANAGGSRRAGGRSGSALTAGRTLRRFLWSGYPRG